MSAEDKAKELVEKFQKQIFFDITNERLDIEEAKGCALICIDEMLEWKEALFVTEGSMAYQWLLHVKQEIQKL